MGATQNLYEFGFVCDKSFGVLNYGIQDFFFLLWKKWNKNDYSSYKSSFLKAKFGKKSYRGRIIIFWGHPGKVKDLSVEYSPLQRRTLHQFYYNRLVESYNYLCI